MISTIKIMETLGVKGVGDNWRLCGMVVEVVWGWCGNGWDGVDSVVLAYGCCYFHGRKHCFTRRNVNLYSQNCIYNFSKIGKYVYGKLYNRNSEFL